MEWTLPGTKLDGRGNRRYFTIASSPTEDRLRLGVKFNPNPSQYKQRMQSLKAGDKIIAGQLAGDFILPKDISKKLVFIAGGIGVTPFRSIIQYLMDQKDKRTIALFYANKTAEEIAYKDFFERAETELGIELVYILTEVDKLPEGLKGEVGRINEEILKKHVPDYKERVFYLSGPIGMVNGYKHLLLGLGVSPTQVVTDYFPGF
jgi:ferredoxin-NADP reductase